MNFHSISHDHLLSLFHFALRPSYGSSLPLPRSFPTRALRNGVSRTESIAINFRIDERSATIAIPSNSCPSSSGERCTPAASRIVPDYSETRGRLGAKRDCSKIRSPRDARFVAKSRKSKSFDRTCENNAVIEKERRYRRNSSSMKRDLQR